jgi:hypothetical protein
MKRMAAVVLLAAMTTPPSAGAGEVARSLDELGRRMKPGQKVQVLERSGRLTDGVITELSESSLTVFAGESRTLAAEEVLRVDREGDSVRNGILIGAASGAALGLVSMLVYTKEDEVTYQCPECNSPTIVGIFAVTGAGWGWLVDHLKKGRTPLYEASLPRPRHASVNVAPIVGKGRRGLAVAVGF